MGWGCLEDPCRRMDAGTGLFLFWPYGEMRREERTGKNIWTDALPCLHTEAYQNFFFFMIHRQTITMSTLTRMTAG